MYGPPLWLHPSIKELELIVVYLGVWDVSGMESMNVPSENLKLSISFFSSCPFHNFPALTAKELS
jgi:hypothetical protein